MLVYLSLMTPFALRVYRLIDESRFLAAASHDLRQPLHALGLFVQALQETSLATRERQVIGNIRRSVDAMEELFNALLDISRLDAGVCSHT